MKEKIQSIKLNGMLCIIFIAITYLVTLNIENGFFHPNWWWMSNNFALTVSGGIAVGWLYSIFSHMDRNIIEYLDNPQQPAIDNLFESYTDEGNRASGIIQETEYQTVMQKTDLEEELEIFKKNEYAKIQEILKQAYFYYKIAINRTELDDLKNGFNNRIVLSSDFKVKRTLEILKKEIEDELPSIESLAKTIDRQTRKKYHWEEYKKYSDSHCASVTKLNGFEEFLKGGGTL